MKITSRHIVGIVGGKGRTGRQFSALFRALGHRVLVSDIGSALKTSDLLKAADIVLFAVPLSDAADIIRTEVIKAKRKDQLILDVSSLKSNEVKAMLRARGEVIGMHPLFGPSTEPKGETIVLCPARASKQTVASLTGLLKKAGLKTVVMTPQEHDRLMSVVQVIPHLKSFLMADTMRDLRVDLTKVLKTCTPTYQLEFNVIGRFLDDHAGLYMPIIFRNPETTKILKSLRNRIDEYIVLAERKDISGAEKRYARSKKFFAPHLNIARAHSEACIRTLLSLSR